MTLSYRDTYGGNGKTPHVYTPEEVGDINSGARTADDIARQYSSGGQTSGKKDTSKVDQYFADRGLGPDTAPRVEIVRLSDVEPEELKWIWHPVLPSGKLAMVSGDPGGGKSTLSCDIAARVTRGHTYGWPNGAPSSKPGAVIMFAAEDDLADTIRPRLDLAGADCNLVFAIKGTERYSTEKQQHVSWSFHLDRDLPLLESKLDELAAEGQPVKLVVIDPISCYMGKSDSHNNAEVRGTLAPLADILAKHDAAGLMVSHLNKSQTGKAVYRSNGSLAFAAAARSAWFLGKDVDNPSRRLLLPVKCNLVEDPKGFAFSIVDGRIAWEADMVAVTADEHMARESDRRDPAESSELNRAVDWLKEQLADGKVLSKVIDSDAKHNDISASTLKRARNQLECKASKEGSQWYLSLPNG